MKMCEQITSDRCYNGEEATILRSYKEWYGSCNAGTNSNNNTSVLADQSWRSSIWMYFKMSIEITVFCGVLVGIFGAFLWWLELNLRMYCSLEWRHVSERVHHTRLIVDIFIAGLVHFWIFACIAPLCDWLTIKKLSLIYICIIAALLDAISRLLLFIFARYSMRWKDYIGHFIFFMTSFTVCYRFARHCKDVGNVRYNVLALTFKLNLQFIFGQLVSIPFILVFLKWYYDSTPIKKTILVCVLIVIFAIPKLFIYHAITNLHGICTPGNEIVLAVVYLTASTVLSRLMQTKIEELSYFTVISVVHGLLNVIDKLLLPLRRKILSCLFHSCRFEGDQHLAFVQRSLFLANQTLISIITESTCIVTSSAAAHLLLYYYKRKEITGERYNGYSLFRKMVMQCSIAIAIEVIFNVIAVKIQVYLCKIPVIGVWKKKWKSIVIIHLIQVLFTVLYFTQFMNNFIVKDYYKEANVTCFGMFKRV